MASARERLVGAARELLWERGYEATSPRAILERSGAGQGSLYHHFSSKADLAAAALAETEAETRARVDAVLRSGGPPLRRVEAYLSLPREALKGCPLGRHAPEPAIAEEAVRGPVGSYFAHVQGLIADALREAREGGELSEEADPEDLAAALFAAAQGGYLLARASGDPESMDRALRGALQLVEAAKAGGARKGGEG